MNQNLRHIAIAAGLLCSAAVQAVEIKGDTVSGSIDSTVSAGAGVRVGSPACSLVLGSVAGSATPLQASGPGAPAGCADAFSSLNDQGNLNYARHDRFTTYLKGTHELLLNFPDDVKFMGRVSWLRDFAATRTTALPAGWARRRRSATMPARTCARRCACSISGCRSR